MLYSSIQPGDRQRATPGSIFDHMKFIDPIDPNRETARPEEPRSIFDYYTPIKMKRPDVNNRCYWDKRTFKIKEDLEKSVEKAADRKRYENYILSQEYNQAQEAESANRRSNLEGELYQL